jgi:hypothetical protein
VFLQEVGSEERIAAKIRYLPDKAEDFDSGAVILRDSDKDGARKACVAEAPAMNEQPWRLKTMTVQCQLIYGRRFRSRLQ